MTHTLTYTDDDVRAIMNVVKTAIIVEDYHNTSESEDLLNSIKASSIISQVMRDAVVQLEAQELINVSCMVVLDEAVCNRLIMQGAQRIYLDSFLKCELSQEYILNNRSYIFTYNSAFQYIKASSCKTVETGYYDDIRIGFHSGAWGKCNYKLRDGHPQTAEDFLHIVEIMRAHKSKRASYIGSFDKTWGQIPLTKEQILKNVDILGSKCPSVLAQHAWTLDEVISMGKVSGWMASAIKANKDTPPEVLTYIDIQKMAKKHK